MVVAVLFKAGSHAPVMPLSEVVGNGAGTAPEQIGETALKDGRITGSTVTAVVAVTPGQPLLAATV